MTTVVKPKAVDLLRRSSLKLTQQELMGEDVDLRSFYLAFNQKNIDIEAALTDCTIQRTIEGASTITATIQDTDYRLLRSGKLSSRQDIEIDGLFFRLVKVSKNGNVLTLTFEDREVAILRTYNKPIKHSVTTSRKNLTRAQFVLRMLREVKELPAIHYVIPELNVTEPIAGAKQLPDTASRLVNRTYGIPALNGLTVKGQSMTAEQRKNADTILMVGVTNAAPVRPRPLLVMSIMAAIQESSIINLGFVPSNLTHRGVFQQDPRYWPASGDVGKDAAAFFRSLKTAFQANPGGQYQDIIEAVQRSGLPQYYAQWKDEAERIVTQFGVIEGAAADVNQQWNVNATVSGDYEFYRGIPPSNLSQKKKGKTGWGKESSWDCMGRLADEVQWRRFFVSGTFYFIADDDLFTSKPIAIIDEDTAGVISIDGDYDENRNQASVTVECYMNRWSAPPGSVIQLRNMGPWNGRWLVNDVMRSAFMPNGTITLKKPLPRLPEPSGSNIAQGVSAGQTWSLTDPPSDNRILQSSGTAAGFLPNGAKYVEGRVDQGRDFQTDPGGPIIAPGAGQVISLGFNPEGFGTAYPIVTFSTGTFKGKTMYIGHCLAKRLKGDYFSEGEVLAVTSVTGNDVWNGNADQPGWCEIGYAPLGVPGPFGQTPPF